MIQRPDCAGCHRRIDPLGFALENYDATGIWRDGYKNGQAVDASGAMAVQLPALRKLGEEVGISLEDGIAGLIASGTPEDSLRKTAEQAPTGAVPEQITKSE